MKTLARGLISVLVLGIVGCSPVSDPTNGGRLDPNLAGTWRRDDDTSGTDSFGDELMIFGSGGELTYGDYLDPDGPGPDPSEWLYYSFGYTWSNGYYHDYRGNNPPNNYVSAGLLATVPGGSTFFLFQYRYSNYPNEIEVLTSSSSSGIWERQ